jgi:hypothetical protein
VYLAQPGGSTGTRPKEQTAYLYLGQPEKSAISEHVTDMGHDIKLTGQGMSMDHLMAKGSRNTVESE